MNKIKWEKWEDIFDREDSSMSGKIVIPTPMGMISHKIGAKSDGGLNFWVGNTNFDLNGLHMGIIDNVDGVEISNLWTSYKFRICIGKVFKTKTVLKDVEIALGCVSTKEKLKLTEEQKSSIIEIKRNISKSKFWAIYILPNGKFDYCGTDNHLEFAETYKFFYSLENSIGGRLLSPTKDKMVY